MKRTFMLLVGVLSVARMAMAAPPPINEDKYYAFEGPVRKMTLELSYGTMAKQSFWYDKDGKLIQHSLQLTGKDGKIAVCDTVTEDGHGKVLGTRELFKEPEHKLPGADKRHYVYVTDDLGNWTWCGRYTRMDDSSSSFMRSLVYENKMKFNFEVNDEFNRIEMKRAAYVKELMARDSLSAEDKAYLSEKQLSTWKAKHDKGFILDEFWETTLIITWVSLFWGGLFSLLIFILYRRYVKGRFVMGYDDRPTEDKPSKASYVSVIIITYSAPFAALILFVIPGFIPSAIIWLILMLRMTWKWFQKYQEWFVLDMIRNKQLSNSFVRIAKFFWLLIGAIYVLTATSLIFGLGVFIGLIILWMAYRKYHNIMLWRCPECHEFDETEYLGRKKDGVRRHESDETSTSTSHRDVDYRTEEDVEETTYTHTVEHYQMYKDTFHCKMCGAYWHHRFEGELLSRYRDIDTETTTTTTTYS